MRKRTGKTPIFQGDKLIGYCSTVVLSMCNDGLDASYRYIIEDFEAEAECLSWAVYEKDFSGVDE